MKIVMVKHPMEALIKVNYQGAVLIPVDDDLKGVPDYMVMAEIKMKRNPGNHRRFFAFIKTTFDMQDEFDNIDVWRKYIQMKGGFFDEIITGAGKVMYWPRSVSWDKLDEIEFKELFGKVFNAFMKYYGQQLSQEQLDTLLEY